MKIIGCSGGEIQRKVGNNESSDGGGPHIRLVHIPRTFNDTIINGKIAEQKQFVSVCDWKGNMPFHPKAEFRLDIGQD